MVVQYCGAEQPSQAVCRERWANVDYAALVAVQNIYSSSSQDAQAAWQEARDEQSHGHPRYAACMGSFGTPGHVKR